MVRPSANRFFAPFGYFGDQFDLTSDFAQTNETLEGNLSFYHLVISSASSKAAAVTVSYPLEVCCFFFLLLSLCVCVFLVIKVFCPFRRWCV